MVLSGDSDTHYRYAKVLGVHHVNVVCIGGPYHTTQRMEFLFVRWYEAVPADASTRTLDRFRFPPLHSQDAFGFLNPSDVLRATHMILRFCKGLKHQDGRGLSSMAGDKGDWCEYYVNR
jgi:hypothetical protein